MAIKKLIAFSANTVFALNYSRNLKRIVNRTTPGVVRFIAYYFVMVSCHGHDS